MFTFINDHNNKFFVIYPKSFHGFIQVSPFFHYNSNQNLSLSKRMKIAIDSAMNVNNGHMVMNSLILIHDV